MRKRLTIALVLLATGVAAARQLPRLQPQATGTGAIVGQVVEAGSGAPVAHARVWLHQTRGERARGVYPRSEQLTTDGSGSFAIRDLPAGQFSLSVTADGYQPGAYGKRRSDGEEAWITLNDDQTVSNATIELFRGGTIGGVVTDDRGEPMKEVFVEIWQRTSTGQLKHRFGARTDATGAYRIIDVPAGDHFVVARVWHDTMRQPPPSAERSSCMIEPPPPAPGTPTSPVVARSRSTPWANGSRVCLAGFLIRLQTIAASREPSLRRFTRVCQNCRGRLL